MSEELRDGEKMPSKVFDITCNVIMSKIELEIISKSTIRCTIIFKGSKHAVKSWTDLAALAMWQEI